MTEALDIIKQSLRENSGGHSLTNMADEKLWYADQPVNLTKLLTSLRESGYVLVDTNDVERMRQALGDTFGWESDYYPYDTEAKAVLEALKEG